MGLWPECLLRCFRGNISKYGNVFGRLVKVAKNVCLVYVANGSVAGLRATELELFMWIRYSNGNDYMVFGLVWQCRDLLTAIWAADAYEWCVAS